MVELGFTPAIVSLGVGSLEVGFDAPFDDPSDDSLAGGAVNGGAVGWVGGTRGAAGAAGVGCLAVVLGDAGC